LLQVSRTNYIRSTFKNSSASLCIHSPVSCYKIFNESTWYKLEISSILILSTIQKKICSNISKIMFYIKFI
jgi:hypothetical protein